jgi:hypothetical protein
MRRDTREGPERLFDHLKSLAPHQLRYLDKKVAAAACRIKQSEVEKYLQVHKDLGNLTFEPPGRGYPWYCVTRLAEHPCAPPACADERGVPSWRVWRERQGAKR